MAKYVKANTDFGKIKEGMNEALNSAFSTSGVDYHSREWADDIAILGAYPPIRTVKATNEPGQGISLDIEAGEGWKVTDARVETFDIDTTIEQFIFGGPSGDVTIMVYSYCGDVCGGEFHIASRSRLNIEYRAIKNPWIHWHPATSPLDEQVKSPSPESAAGYVFFELPTSDETPGVDCEKIIGVTNVKCNALPTLDEIIAPPMTKAGISGSDASTSILVSIKATDLTGDLTTESGRVSAFETWFSANDVKIAYRVNGLAETEAIPLTDPVFAFVPNETNRFGAGLQGELTISYQEG